MGGGNLCIEPKDLQLTTLHLEPFLEQDNQPVTRASPAPDLELTAEAAPM